MAQARNNVMNVFMISLYLGWLIPRFGGGASIEVNDADSQKVALFSMKFRKFLAKKELVLTACKQCSQGSFFETCLP